MIFRVSPKITAVTVKITEDSDNTCVFSEMAASFNVKTEQFWDDNDDFVDVTSYSTAGDGPAGTGFVQSLWFSPKKFQK